MSESEKKRRGIYRKNREKWIFAQSVIIAVVAIAVLISGLVSYQLNEKYYIGYTERGNIDYDVYLKENEFYDSPYLEKDQSYVASLIDRIITSFSYQIDMDTDDVYYRYSYSIKSRLEIIDDTSKVAIFNPEYDLIEVNNKSQSSSNRLIINEMVVLNYDEYNELANRFLETYALTETTSHIVLTLSVDVLSDCDAFSGSSVDTYSSELRIPLTTKTVNIHMTSSVPDAEAKMIACTRGVGSEAFKTTAIVLSVVDVLLILLLVAFIYLTRTADITYTARVKKIVSQYKSYIQKIKNMFDTRGYQVILVDTFDEMLEIRDTIQAPILMFENADKTCAKFMIPTDSKLLYLYEIKIEGYTDPEPEPEPDPTPTTIVRPNITNVVRPVVKVTVNQPTKASADESDADIRTVVEDAEVEVMTDDGELPEVIATVEENEELVPEAMEVIATVEEATEALNEEDEELTTVIDGKVVQFRYRKSFESRLIQSDDRIKGYYGAIKNKLLSYKGVKARTSWSFESCNKGRIQCAKLNIRGKTLLLYLNLDTDGYNVNKYHFKNVADKAKYEDVPMLLKVRSDRGLKYALELIGEMMNVLEIPEGEIRNDEYHIPYRTTEQLIEEGLIKLILPNEDEDVEDDAEGLDSEVESILASIPSADDSHTQGNVVDAIDVFLGKNQTATYNPDGNSLERGDVVLVPTRDEANDKDVAVEAEVARGNYKVEAASLDRPLQKIIGVVRKKAEQIFTAMITPTEENKD
ncbi:MAG: hypothetical protein IKC31_07900 [Clostridia bacterium]|nr:hypothetical protein [Clostridia bacterium]